MRWGCSILIVAFFAILLALGSGRTHEPVIPTATPETRLCSYELIRLAEQVLQDESYRNKNIDRLKELDPSGDMLIAIELMDNPLLQEIIKETQDACR